MKSVTEWHDVDEQRFRQRILPLNQPAILRQVVKHWPAVQAATISDEALMQYLHALDNGREVNTILAHADTKGQISYNASLTGFNFERHKAPVSAVLSELKRIEDKLNALYIAVQSARADDCMPGFSAQNVMPLLTTDISARIWLGNKVVVPAHFDHADNIACVVAGRRRFTLFPPEQVSNLYIGPLDFTPSGAPVSLVEPAAPDFERFPRFAKALDHAQLAELAPGDALYIPSMWWHQVESLSSVSMLVNYWWGGSLGDASKGSTPFDSLLHSLLTIKTLPEQEKKHWQAFFNHFLFHTDGDPTAHLGQEHNAVQGTLSATRENNIKAWLRQQLE